MYMYEPENRFKLSLLLLKIVQMVLAVAIIWPIEVGFYRKGLFIYALHETALDLGFKLMTLFFCAVKLLGIFQQALDGLDDRPIGFKHRVLRKFCLIFLFQLFLEHEVFLFELILVIFDHEVFLGDFCGLLLQSCLFLKCWLVDFGQRLYKLLGFFRLRFQIGLFLVHGML